MKKNRGNVIQLDALRCLGNLDVGRVSSAGEIENIVSRTKGLLGDLSVGVDEFVRNRTSLRRAAKLDQARLLFGLDRPDSSLMQPPLNWKMSLSERITTETLARLLNAGELDARADRIKTFLRALGLKDSELDAGGERLDFAHAFAEVPAIDGRRIDLKILWRTAKKRERVLVIEAKFDHVITNDQLRYYRESTKREHPYAARRHLVLALDKNAMRPVNPSKDGNWLFCSWRDLWLRFEIGRPQEHDISLQLFLHALWRRIGRLNPKNAHAQL